MSRLSSSVLVNIPTIATTPIPKKDNCEYSLGVVIRGMRIDLRAAQNASIPLPASHQKNTPKIGQLSGPHSSCPERKIGQIRCAGEPGLVPAD